jgi:hypothetical protein
MYDRAAVARRAIALGLAILGVGATAGSAGATTLSISVPHRVDVGSAYTIKITGSFERAELVGGRAYLIAAIQFSGAPCQPTALAENNLHNQPQFYFGPQVGVYESRSPFTRSDLLRARSPGMRRVCSYLYPQFVGATENVAPIATAEAAYRELRRPHGRGH